MAIAPSLEMLAEGSGWVDRTLCAKGFDLCCVISGDHCI